MSITLKEAIEDVEDEDLSIDETIAALQKVQAKAPNLDGYFFHSRGETGELCWQGQILSQRGSMYTIQLFSWLTGDANGKMVVPSEVVSQFVIYPDYDSMNDAYDRYVERGRGRL